MPTSPLPSSATMAGPKWPKDAYKISFTEETKALSAFGEKDSGFPNSKQFPSAAEQNKVQGNDFSSENSKLKLTVDIPKGKKDDECEELKPFLDTERVSLNSDCSTNTGYRTYVTDVDNENIQNSKVTYCRERCENCARLSNYGHELPPERTTVNIPEDRQVIENERNCMKYKKNKRQSWCKLLAVSFIVGILLIAVASLVTYLLTNKPREIPDPLGNNPKSETSIENVTNEPYMTELNRMLISRMFLDRDKHSKKLAGIYMNLDSSSLKEKEFLLKWKVSPSERFMMTNHGIKYSNGLFRVPRDGWYILYSKLYLVTYKEYDKSGNVSMKLYNYQHCVDFEVNHGQKAVDSICNMGSFWGGHKGANHIWKPVFLKEGVSVKVTMRNKDIVSPDEIWSSFEMIELARD